jgi:GTP-binding protein
VLPVPPGTIVRDAASGELLGEVLDEGDTILIARAAAAGAATRSSPRHASGPREWEPGDEGEQKTLELELKLIADVGSSASPTPGSRRSCR